MNLINVITSNAMIGMGVVNLADQHQSTRRATW